MKTSTPLMPSRGGLASLLALGWLVACGGGGEPETDGGDGGSSTGAVEPAAGAGEGEGAGAEPEDDGTEATDGGGAAAATTGTVSGVIHAAGEIKKNKRLDLSGTPQCAQRHTDPLFDQRYMISEENELANCLVWLNVEGEYDAPEENALLDQVDCVYTPRVIGMQLGQVLTVRNSDDFPHNVHLTPRNNEPENLGQPRAMTSDIEFTEEEELPIMVKCDLHKWMRAYVGLFTHPFWCVTDEKGTFEIKNIPPGSYTLTYWHERKGKAEVAVEVTAGGTLALDDLVVEF